MRLRIRTRDTYQKHPDLLNGSNLIVENASNGEQLHGVEAIELSCAGRNQPIVAKITLRGVDVDITVPLSDAQSALVRLLGNEREDD